MFDAIQRLFAKRQVQPAPNEQRGGYAIAWPRRSDAGVFVSEDSALGCDVAWACGTLIARSIAMLPARVMAPIGPEDGDGNEHLAAHPVEALMHREANPELTAFQFREGALLSAIFLGNAIAEIERDQLGRPLALWPINFNRVKICRNETTNALEYEVWNGDDGLTTLAPENVFHLAGPGLSGFHLPGSTGIGPVGMSLISHARQSLGLAIAQERFAANFIRNQAAPSGMVKIKNIKPEGLKLLKAEFEQLNSGLNRAGKILYGDGEWEWTPLGVSPQDAEFLAQRRFSVETICRWFGVPPQMVGDQSRMTLNNYEQSALSFLTLAVTPWIVRLEQEVNRKLLNRTVNGRRPFLKVNANAIVRANSQARNYSYALGRQWGWLSVNDIRRLEDQEPIGPEGDVYLQPMNMEPVGEPPGEQDTQSETPTEDQRDQVATLRRVK